MEQCCPLQRPRRWSAEARETRVVSNRVIPLRADHRARLAHRPGRRPLFSREDYRRRNTVERGINRLKQWRGLATRYDRRADHYRAVAVIVALILWLHP